MLGKFLLYGYISNYGMDCFVNMNIVILTVPLNMHPHATLADDPIGEEAGCQEGCWNACREEGTEFLDSGRPMVVWLWVLRLLPR